MSQSNGALETPALDFSLGQELPEDPQAAEVARAKAAASVSEFAQSSSLEALDAVLSAAQRGARVPAETTRSINEKSRLLDAEVRRFRALNTRS